MNKWVYMFVHKVSDEIVARFPLVFSFAHKADGLSLSQLPPRQLVPPAPCSNLTTSSHPQFNVSFPFIPE